MVTSNKFLIDVFNNLQLQNDEIKENIEALNNSINDNKEVNSNKSKGKSKDFNQLLTDLSLAQLSPSL